VWQTWRRRVLSWLWLRRRVSRLLRLLIRFLESIIMEEWR
jgi:hypothetical protein